MQPSLKASRALGVSLATVLTVSALTACSGAESAGEPTTTAPTTEATASTEAALASDAYTQCSAILARGLHDEYERSTNAMTAGVLTDWACDKTHREADVDTEWSMGFLGKMMGVEADGSGSATEEYCESRQRPYVASSFSYYALDRVANANVVDAWRDCMTSKNQGFVCEPRKVGSDTVEFNFGWDTQEADPQLRLTWATQDNVTALGPLPTGMGEGDLGVDFRIRDTSRNATLRVNATGNRPGGGTFQRSCVTTIQPPPPPVKPPPPPPDRATLILGVGDTSYSLWVKEKLSSGWEGVESSDGIIDATVMPDGSILAVGQSFSLWRRKSLAHAWKAVPNSLGVRSVAVMKDGTILGVGNTSYSLWKKRTLDSEWVAVPNSDGVRDVAVMPDGTILGVGNTSYSLWTKRTLESDWVGVPNSGGIRSVDVMKDGTIIGVGDTSYSLWTKSSLRASWVGVPNSRGVQSVAVGSVRLE